MQHKAILVFILFTFIGCASRQPFQSVTSIPDFSEPAMENAAPKLVLEAHPRVGFAPLRVTVKAVLKNVPSTDPMFSCVWKSWNFGDGAVSAEKNHCTQNVSVDSEYFVDHIYRNEGVYQIRFTLGDNQIHSNTVQIRVVGYN